MEKTKKIILTAGILFMIYLLTYTPYVEYICRKYAKEFANVIGSYDIEQYDEFFSKDTIFQIGDRKWSYSEFSRKLIDKRNIFSAGDSLRSSYGSLKEGSKVLFERNFTVLLAFPIAITNPKQDLGRLTHAEIILERQWLFFFKIKRVTLEDREVIWERLLSE